MCLKKLISLLLLIPIVCACFSGVAFTAAADSLDRAMNSAKPELYGMYTPQSASVLRDVYDRAAALKATGATDSSLAFSLRNALGRLVTLDEYTRVALAGFGGVTENDIASMKLNAGGVSVSGGAVTLRGEGALRYCNAAEDGIAGPSPFGADLSDADGLAITITSSAKAALDFEIGVRGSESDCVFIISDAAVSAGEKTYFFPFARFGFTPADGALNYISLTFTGTPEVTFGDLHGVADSLDDAKKSEYTETPATPETLSAKKYYKLLQKDSALALTLFKATGEGDGTFGFTEDDPAADAQLWQICPDPEQPDRYRIVNKHFGYAIRAGYNSELGFLPNSVRADLTNAGQAWSFTYNENGFAFFINNWSRMSYSGDKFRLTGINAEVKYFDLVEAGGPEWTQTWSDEFNGAQLDRDVWHVLKETKKCYALRDSTDNVCVTGGNLVIHTFKEEYNGRQATTGHIRSEFATDFGYGRYEYRSKLPEGDGVWPAFWMMGEEDLFPYTAEIDVLEMIGTGETDGFTGEKKAFATFHYAGDDGRHVEKGGWTDLGILHTKEPLSDDYHIYAVEWDKDQLRWYFDDLLYMVVNIEGDALERALHTNPIYLIISVGLNCVGDQLPEHMVESFLYVDYVRYYKDSSAAKPQKNVAYNVTDSKPAFSQVFSYAAQTGAYCAATDTLVYSTGAGESRTYGVSDMAFRSILKLEGGERDWIMSSAVSADGSKIALGSRGKLTVTGPDLTAPISIGFPSEYPAIALSNNGSRCYAGGTANDDSDFSQYLYVYDTSDMHMLRREYTGSWVDTVAVAANDYYAYGCFNGAVYVRTASGIGAGNFRTDGRIVSMVFSQDCKKLYAASADSNIYVYDLETQTASVFASCVDEIYQLALSPDGTRIAAACGDSCARVWDTATGRLVLRPCLGSLLATNVAYSSDGKLLVVSGTDGRIGLYRTDDGLPLALLTEGVPRWYNTVALNEDSSVLMAIRYVTDYKSGPVAWQLPEDMIPADGGDSAALRELPFVDEAAYTPESYAPYATALKNAHAVRANRYSAQSVIDSATAAVEEAAGGLVKAGLLKGDQTGDGKIAVDDALRALRFAAKLAEADANALYVCDIDGDGEITVADALMILRAAVGLAQL